MWLGKLFLVAFKLVWALLRINSDLSVKVIRSSGRVAPEFLESNVCSLVSRMKNTRQYNCVVPLTLVGCVC